jgi:tetratricopeptide (TPR) repeat protein
MPGPGTLWEFGHPLRKYAGMGLVALCLAACGTAPLATITARTDTSTDTGTDNGSSEELAESGIAIAASHQKSAVGIAGKSHEIVTISGHFLAARQALYLSDVRRSAAFFLEAIDSDAPDVALLRQAFLTQYYYGDIEKAAAIGRQIEQLNLSMALAGEPGTALAIRNHDWPATLVLADVIAEDINAMDVAGVISAWATAANGQGDAGILQLIDTGRQVAGDNAPLPDHIQLNIMLMAEFLGLDDEARRRASDVQQLNLSAGMTIQLAGFLVRNGKLQEAQTLLDNRLSRQFNRRDVMGSLVAHPDRGTDIDTLIANNIIEVAIASQSDAAQRALSARLRLALFVAPNLDFGHLLLAQELSDFGQYEEAIRHLDQIAVDAALGQPAQLLKASIIEGMDDPQRAVSILKATIIRDRENSYLHHRMGDSYRRIQAFAESRDAYMKAMALGSDSGALHRNLGMALERLGEDMAAETHLLRAVELDPSDAYALNYLGYWWADEGRNLDQAIGLIERAVEQRPGSGFFVDSLGWVHFKLGNPQKAVDYLERATELEPSDAEITGHLGDAYWVLGRQDEARFKWRLALSLSVDPEERAMLSSRLENGLSPSDMPAVN